MLYHAKLIPWRLSWLERLQYGQTETGNEDSRALCFRKQYTVLQLFAQHAIWFLYIQEERPIVCYIAGYMIQKTHSRKKLRRQYIEIQICRCNNRERINAVRRRQLSAESRGIRTTLFNPSQLVLIIYRSIHCQGQAHRTFSVNCGRDPRGDRCKRYFHQAESSGLIVAPCIRTVYSLRLLCEGWVFYYLQLKK